MPFITPSRCAETPMRMLVKRCSSSPVTSPSRNKNMPCHINRRLAGLILISPFERVHVAGSDVLRRIYLRRVAAKMLGAGLITGFVLDELVVEDANTVPCEYSHKLAVAF